MIAGCNPLFVFDILCIVAAIFFFGREKGIYTRRELNETFSNVVVGHIMHVI